MNISTKQPDFPGYQKIWFKLKRDVDGYPPDDWETMWAQKISANQFQIDNVPFYVQGVSNQDIVEVTNQEKELHFYRVIQPSMNSVIRIIVYEDIDVIEVKNILRSMQCSIEVSHIERFLAVDIPPAASIQLIREYLDKGEQEERWSYEEGCIRHR